MTARALATKTLKQIVGEHKTIKAAFAAAGAMNLSERDRAFAQELVYGVCRWYFDLEQTLNGLLKKPLRAKDLDIQCLIMLGLYQLIHLETPEHAVVKETVGVTKFLKKHWAKGLVNACLRSAIRAGLAAEWDANEASTRNQAPWFVKELQQDWPDHYQEILTAYNARPPLTIRVNVSHIARQDYLKTLADAQVDARALPHANGAVQIYEPRPMTSLPGFADGLVSAQDQAAQLAASILAPEPGERILDACAAPGGKTCHCLEITNGGIDLTAIDNVRARLDLVEQNLSRQKYQAKLICDDASEPAAWWDKNHFDRILLDAPCSASGVIRRHPDIKLHRRQEDLASLSNLQSGILNGLWQTLKPGGTLLYVTCSVFKCENDGVIGAFAEQHSDCKILDITRAWGHATCYGRQVLPGDDDMDGFYFAHLRKINHASESN